MPESYFLNGYYKKTYDQRLNYLLKHFDFKNKTVLELGGAIGYISNELSLHGAKCTVVEARKVNVEFGQKKYPHLTFIISDLENDFDFGKYDYVLNFGLIYHMKNFRNCILNSLKSLNENGILMIDSNVIEDMDYKIKEKRENINVLDQAFINDTVYDFTPKVIEECFEGYNHKRIKDELKHEHSPHDYNYGRAFWVVKR